MWQRGSHEAGAQPLKGWAVDLEKAGDDGKNIREGNADSCDVQLGRPVQVRCQVHLMPLSV